jgi:hypothetical protein
MLIYFFVLQGHVEDDEDVDEYNDIADILNEYDEEKEEEDGIGEANDSKKENEVSDLVETIFSDGEKILGEIDELTVFSEVTDKLAGLKIVSSSPHVEGE